MFYGYSKLGQEKNEFLLVAWVSKLRLANRRVAASF